MTATSIPEPHTAPGEISDNTWNPSEAPESVAGIVTSRITANRRSDGSAFEILSIDVAEPEQYAGTELRVLCGRSHLSQLVRKHDPQKGDAIRVTYFGREDGGQRYLYGLSVSKAANPAVGDELAAASDAPF